MKAFMKCAFLLIAACLAVTTLAAVPFYDKRAIEQFVSAHWKRNTTIGTNTTFEAIPENILDTMGTPPGNITDLLTGGSYAADNVTAMALQNLFQKWTIDFRMAGPEQHVGTLRGTRLFWKLKSCFERLGDGHKCGNKDFCKDVDPCCQKDCEIPNIVYQDGHGHYATNAYLKVKFWWAEIQDSTWPGLRTWAYETAAQLITASTTIEDNCYYVDFENSRRTKFCNIPRHTMIILPSDGQAGHPARVVLNIITEFNGATSHKGWNFNVQMERNQKVYDDYVAPGLLKLFGIDDDDLTLQNRILEDKCFNTRHGNYKLNSLWKEPNIQGCV